MCVFRVRGKSHFKVKEESSIVGKRVSGRICVTLLDGLCCKCWGKEGKGRWGGDRRVKPPPNPLPSTFSRIF